MINKKNLLGKRPNELGTKDAIHTAIVSLRAGGPLSPGQHITLNKDGEAISCDQSKSFGVVDPFLKSMVTRGSIFWGLMKLDEIPNVQHYWEHPDYTFEAPKTKPSRNLTIESYAEEFKVDYDELMKAASSLVDTGNQVPYTGKLTEGEFDKALNNFERYNFWSEWAEESLYEFENFGSACCPEFEYPSDFPFYFVDKS